MRKLFADELLRHAKKDHDIVVVTADLGFKLWDEFRDTLPDQFYNIGAAETTAANICVGLAMMGKKPYFYSITSFLLYRPFEVIRLYINKERWNVKLIGSGRNDDYRTEGWSHDSTDAKQILDLLPNIRQSWPETKEEIPQIVNEMIAINEPWFISLRK